MNRSALILSSAFCLPALAGGHVARADAQVAMCETSAWSTDKDPNGLNVRAGPGTDNPVIGRLPPPLATPGALPHAAPHDAAAHQDRFR